MIELFIVSQDRACIGLRVLTLSSDTGGLTSNAPSVLLNKLALSGYKKMESEGAVEALQNLKVCK